MFDNKTYQLSELDEMMLQVPIAGKRVKVSKKWNDAEPYVAADDTGAMEEA